eukprot:4464021-Pyramimonas_sp.AAC.1
MPAAADAGGPRPDTTPPETGGAAAGVAAGKPVTATLEAGVTVALLEAGALGRFRQLFGADLAPAGLALMWRHAAPAPPGELARSLAAECVREGAFDWSTAGAVSQSAEGDTDAAEQALVK